MTDDREGSTALVTTLERPGTVGAGTAASPHGLGAMGLAGRLMPAVGRGPGMGEAGFRSLSGGLRGIGGWGLASGERDVVAQGVHLGGQPSGVAGGGSRRRVK